MHLNKNFDRKSEFTCRPPLKRPGTRYTIISYRKACLNKVTKNKNERTVLSLTYNPKLPSVPQIIKKHWRTLTKDIKMLKTFPKPPMVAFRQPPNLKSMLYRAKLPSKQKQKRILLGMKPCHNS